MDYILISQNHPGQFGNKLLHYHNGYQISKYFNCGLIVLNDFNFSFFDIDTKNYEEIKSIVDKYNEEDVKYIDSSMILTNGIDYYSEYKCLILKPCLGELFYEFDYNNRDMISIKDKYKYKKTISDKGYTNIGVHFRGKDFHTWDPKSILDMDYYLNSINYCLKNYNNIVFKISTDDDKLNTYNMTIKYLKDNKLKYKQGDIDREFIFDFVRLMNCDVIISSPSTFSICAGFLNKNKDIIHSKKWVDYRCEKNDRFWIKLLNGGNKNYNTIKII